MTIMRDGKVIFKGNVSDTTLDAVVENMLGRKMEESFPPRRTNPGEVCFRVENLTDHTLIDNVSLNIRKGEIVGIAGLVGAGKTELCKAIFGAERILAGKSFLYEKELKIHTPSDAVDNGVALVPEDRRTEGLLVEEPVFKNLTLASLDNFSLYGFLKLGEEIRAAFKTIRNLKIKTPSERQKVTFLSGGNQQKIAVGKWLISAAEVYIFDEPTKGIDVGAKKEIYDLIMTLAYHGKSIIYATCETHEILGLCDRLYVMYDGKIAKELLTEETSEEEILYYSVGGAN
jgi:simple sugar transport system ATP-binding protein